MIPYRFVYVASYGRQKIAARIALQQYQFGWIKKIQWEGAILEGNFLALHYPQSTFTIESVNAQNVIFTKKKGKKGRSQSSSRTCQKHDAALWWVSPSETGPLVGEAIVVFREELVHRFQFAIFRCDSWDISGLVC